MVELTTTPVKKKESLPTLQYFIHLTVKKVHAFVQLWRHVSKQCRGCQSQLSGMTVISVGS